MQTFLMNAVTFNRHDASTTLQSATTCIPPPSTVRSVSMRDMGTEMTPIASQEPSRTGTPVRATSPNCSRPTTPRRTLGPNVQLVLGDLICILLSRFKREEIKIQAWEDHQKAQIEAEMRKIEVSRLFPVNFARQHKHNNGNRFLTKSASY